MHGELTGAFPPAANPSSHRLASLSTAPCSLSTMGGPAAAPNAHDGHLRITYDEIHVTIGQTAQRIKEQFEYVPLGSPACTQPVSLFVRDPQTEFLNPLSAPTSWSLSVVEGASITVPARRCRRTSS